MGIFFSYDDLNDGLRDAGYNSASIAKKAANGVANFACNLYKDYPWAMTAGGLNPFAKGVWDSLCEPRLPELPSMPHPSFNGGQCDCISYLVDVMYTNQNNVFPTESFAVRGPISAVYIAVNSSIGSVEEAIAIDCRGSSSSSCLPPTTIKRRIAQTNTGTKAKIVGIRVTREDGQADNCGNPTTNYPNTPIPNGRESGSQTIINNDGTSFDIGINYFPSPDGLGGDFVVNGGLHFHFGSGGVTVSNSGDNEDQGNNGNENKGDNKDDNSEDKNPANSDNGNNDNQPQPPENGGYTKVIKNGGNSGEIRGLTNLHWVALDLTQIPTNAKRQNGFNAPNLYYAGWFQFVVDSKYLPREPVSFQHSMFQCPLGATGYAYTLYQGFTCNLTEYTKVSNSNNSDGSAQTSTQTSTQTSI